MERITVVKIGGNVIDSPEATARFVEAFAALEGPKMLVHGGGKLATRLAAQLGIESRMVDGRRITDRETLDVVTMVYAGLINKQLVAGLQAEGCNALGLSGADGNVVTARRRVPEPVDYGFVGDIERVDDALLERLLEAGLTPVFPAIMHDGRGTLLNCNADGVATALATCRPTWSSASRSAVCCATPTTRGRSSPKSRPTTSRRCAPRGLSARGCCPKSSRR